MKSLVQYIIEAQSKPTLEWMEEHYRKYNEELFNNELPSKIRLGLISRKTDVLGWQGYDKPFYSWKHKMRNDMYIIYRVKPERSDIEEKLRTRKAAAYFVEGVFEEIKSCEELDPYIELNPKYNFSDFQKEDTMIHEMIHLWVSRNALFPKQAHGKEFRSKCNEIRQKAKELYGIEYELTTYASQSPDEDKSWSVDKSVETEISDNIVKAAKRGGGVVSVYMIFDKDKMPGETEFDLQLRQYTKRFFFCTKSMLPKFIDKITNQKGLTDVYISSSSYIPFAKRFGKMKTINKWGVIWDATEFDENLFIEGAETHNTFNESLSLNEGLFSKLKNIVKNIMNVFVRVDKSTPASEIDMEKMLDYAEEVEEHDSEQNGSNKNDKKAIEI